MGSFTFQVACLRLVANEPLFGVYAVPVDWPVLRQSLRVVEVLVDAFGIIRPGSSFPGTLAFKL